MKLLLTTPLLLLASAPRTGSDVTLTLGVESGTVLTKSFTSELALELDEIEIEFVVDGEEQALETPEVEMSITDTETLTFTDEYLALADGRATKLKRSFDELSETSARSFTGSEGESSDSTEDGESGLEGHAVVLTWDEDSEEWGAAWADDGEELDAELLADLEHHADLVEFLPAGEVAVGAEWSVPAKAFLHLSNPSGDVHLETPTDAARDDQELHDQLDENLEGEILAKLASVTDGLATIELTFDLSTSGEVDEGPQEGGEGPSLDLTRAVSLAFDLEGQLVWNVTEGRPVSLTVDGDTEFSSRETREGDHEGVALRFVQTQRFTGTLKLAVEID